MTKSKPKKSQKVLGKSPLIESEKIPDLKKSQIENDLPPFPKPGMGPGEYSLGNGETDRAVTEDIEEICQDIISVPFEVWSILKPGVTPLSPAEKKLIGKPLARVVVKYDITRYMKDEFLLFGMLGFSVLKRLKVKKNAIDDSRKTGEGKDDSSKEPTDSIGS